MITKCEDHAFPCQNPGYDEFDTLARMELASPTDASSLVNHSYYCMKIPVDESFAVGDLNSKLFLKPLRDRAGLYQLWIDHENCDDHDTYTMLCVYVGKGPPTTRVDIHIKDRWPKIVDLYMTFTPMSNRLAKYYEQLFLDVYQFHLNRAENSGSNLLYAVWDNERYIIGTHLNEVSALSQIRSIEDF